jgi:hypothetical protein
MRAITQPVEELVQRPAMPAGPPLQLLGGLFCLGQLNRQSFWFIE